jgi:hypothetical protein
MVTATESIEALVKSNDRAMATDPEPEADSYVPVNPFARRTARLRSFMLDAVSEQDVRAVIAKLVELAKGGDMAAIRELLNRTIGKPGDAMNPDRMELDEARIIEAVGDAKRCASLFGRF